MMRLSELKTRLTELKEEGFIPSERRGPTGVGYTLERRLGLTENNLPIPDIGGRVEVKATRSTTNNLITLFTFNRGVWHAKQKEVIDQYGYIDDDGRPSLYTTVSAIEPNAQGFQLTVSKDATSLSLTHVSSQSVLATWDLFYIVGKFVTKFERMLFVQTEPRKQNSIEEFHYKRAELLSEPSSLTFRNGFANGAITIDVRMHLRPNGSTRNHGTAFRIREHDLPSLFGKIIQLV